MIRKHRNYKAEYERRIARGIAKGLSRSQSRGHPKATDFAPGRRQLDERKNQLEQALKLMKEGSSQKAAAKAAHLSTERLRTFMRTFTDALHRNGKWVIRDKRAEMYWIAFAGRRLAVTLTKDEGSKVGFYWNSVNRFLNTNDIAHLQAIKNGGVTDMKGKYHPFELRPLRLRRLDSMDELNFIEIYADVAW